VIDCRRVSWFTFAKNAMKVPATPPRISTGYGFAVGAAGIVISAIGESSAGYAIIRPIPNRSTSGRFANAPAMKPTLITARTQPMLAAPRCRSRTK
jgi:hypothetical protein